MIDLQCGTTGYLKYIKYRCAYRSLFYRKNVFYQVRHHLQICKRVLFLCKDKINES